jgi:hypothetical protein
MPKNLSVAVQYRDGEGTSASLGNPPDIILPSQYFGVVQRREYLTPEQKLMLAVLESAVHDFKRYRRAEGRRGRRLFSEVQEWLTSQEETGMFSFVGICHALGMDPDYIRKGLAASGPPERVEEESQRWW